MMASVRTEPGSTGHSKLITQGAGGGSNYRSKALLHVSVGYISSSEAEFSSHKMKWAIRLTQVFQRVDSLYPMV